MNTLLIFALEGLLEESEQIEIVPVTGNRIDKELLGMRLDLSSKLLISMLQFVNQTAELGVKMIFDLVVGPENVL